MYSVGAVLCDFFFSDQKVDVTVLMDYRTEISRLGVGHFLLGIGSVFFVFCFFSCCVVTKW